MADGLERDDGTAMPVGLHIHKAAPAAEFADDAETTCVHCHRTIKRVPGGLLIGPSWVHGDGRVLGTGPTR